VTDLQLLVDQGNTRLKWIWVRDGAIAEDTAGRGSLGDLAKALEPGETPGPTGIRICSVAGPEPVADLRQLCLGRWNLEPCLMESRAEQGGIRNGYVRPQSLGVDRWMAIVGAATVHGAPVVIWDLGTAATLDAVDASGQHLGGWILPGPGTMLRALRDHTKLNVPQDVDGVKGLHASDSTAEAIRTGVLAAQVGAVECFIGSLSDRDCDDATLVVTGGAAGDLLGALDIDHVFDPLLVFRGMLVD
jgi:type III pantothenate kinase